uniref:Uncharacterized protein n=1 Tax=Pinguiococcus pyrenoidosus TaxID=172671 RepID=A0A7R9UCC4_9STRA
MPLLWSSQVSRTQIASGGRGPVPRRRALRLGCSCFWFDVLNECGASERERRGARNGKRSLKLFAPRMSGWGTQLTFRLFGASRSLQTPKMVDLAEWDEVRARGVGGRKV